MNSTIRFGERINLSDGSRPILRGFQEFRDGTRKAFVEHEKPVPWGVDGKTVLGYATRVWVQAPGFVAVKDRDGVTCGIRYQS